MDKITLQLDAEGDRTFLKRIAKSNDMALVLWELQNNFWRKWKHDDSSFDLEVFKKGLSDLLAEYHVDPDDLV